MKSIVLKSILIFVALCFFSSCKKATVTPVDNTVSAASSTPILIVNTIMTTITHTTTGATGIGTAMGLPAGVTATWDADQIIISGTPTESGTFNYLIPLTGGSGTVNATGTIIVYPICDYLPLNVGAKYLYAFTCYYDDHGYVFHSEKGECLWEFTDRNLTPPYIYKVIQTVNGIHVKEYAYGSLGNDTTVISNRVDSLTFKENEDGTVLMTFPMLYWGQASQILYRYMQCSESDICLNYFPPLLKTCLAQNIGIKTINCFYPAIHYSTSTYTLIKGPY